MILAILNDSSKSALRRKASMNWEEVLTEIAEYLAGGETWQKHFEEPVKVLMGERITDLESEFRKSRKQADLLTEEWFDEYTITFSQPINATTEEAIRRLIEQGVNEGWSIPTLQDRLEAMFTQWMTGTLSPDDFTWFAERMPEYRREMIARTETIKALNTVSYRLFGSWGVTEKEWLATADNRTRDTHRALDGVIVGIDKPFSVGGFPMLYPGDPAGPASEVVNCRCTIIPVM